MASNIRVLVSNLGDGNWTSITTVPVTADEFQPNILTTDSVRCFFPPGETAAANNVPTAAEKDAAPSAKFCIGGNIDNVGWGSKTNWLFQLKNTATATTNSAEVKIYGYRPTGVAELIETVGATVMDGGMEYTYGGADGEEVYGPFVAFKFFARSVTNAPVIECSVVGWNYGDVWETDPSIVLISEEGE